MFTLRVYNAVSSKGLDLFSSEHFVRDDDHPAPDLIVLRSENLHQIEIPDSVRAIGRAGAGVNNIPVPEMTERGVFVFNTPGANANAVRELVLGALLMSARNLPQAWEYTRNLTTEGDALHKEVEAGKKRFAGSELPGRTIGIVGLGAIGRAVAEGAIALGMKVVGYDPVLTVDGAWALPAGIERARDVNDLVRKSDFVSCHVPLNDHTRGMINADVLADARPGITVLNFARDEVVDDDAVRDALESGRVFRYLTDFPTAQLKNRDDVIALPHLGASTAEAEENCAIMVANQLCEFLLDGHVTNSVNFPGIRLGRGSPHRLFVANANVPNMVGQISTAMADAGLNIHDMINQSRGDVACTVVDVDSDLPAAVIDKISGIEGVLRAFSVQA